ncbi:MAG: hypothetical protein A3H91_05325 [Gammaproteobacteria bacterium RIFCSPLOWO2_02_FULL_61_13]|nr:MAG: hypothetical protein A3H91_05325 [Gammaproteobacteria bacterium RIFCSPLOWO2_02_FULL_61_13]
MPEEVAAAPLARRILDHGLVLFRTGTGRLVALADRCAHRLAPLSVGCVAGEHLRCGYHGAEFAADGRCVVVPGQGDIPQGARVRSFPILERYGFIWVWMGEPGLSSLSQPCGIFGYLEQGDWSTRDGYIPIACNYLLVNDNLADVSHTEFVHATTLGSPNARATRKDGMPLEQQGQHTFQAELRDGGIDFCIRFSNTRVAQVFETAYARVRGRDGWDTLDFRLEFVFRPPGFWIFRPITMRSGAAPEQGVQLDAFIVVTPATATTCHYFHKSCQAYAPRDAEETDYWHEQTGIAFREDKAILEAQQRNMGAGDLRDFPHVSFQGDRLGFQARRLIADLVAAERGSPATAAV